MFVMGNVSSSGAKRSINVSQMLTAESNRMAAGGVYLSVMQLQNIIRATAQEAVREYVRATSPASDEITEAQAYKKYGRGNMEHWRALGKLKYKRAGEYRNSRKYYSVKELDDLAMGINPLIKSIGLQQ
jgi:hypothetical protein